ncbi:hypothetical protein OG979_16525 [Actinomadura citrea]|uniref:hypothetical protein n=1 Tax=Actinomadura TaxID=1988 RepID=UPI002E295579|nr:hypothetical protein [Actinomadura citrea]
MLYSAIVIFLLSVWAGREAKAKSCDNPKDCKRLKDRGGLIMASAGLVVFVLAELPPVILAAAAPGFLVGLLTTKKPWVAWPVAIVAILIALNLSS